MITISSQTKCYITELVGTFFLFLAICFTSNALAIGLILAAMIYIGQNRSGAHYNPAITLAVWLKGSINPIQAAGYVVSQCLGALAAAATFYALSKNTFSPMPHGNVTMWQAIVLEALFTFIFCSVALTCSSHMHGVTGLIIGLTLTACIFCIAELTGAAINPAVAVGPMVWNMLLGSQSAFTHLPIYLLGPSLGALCAALYYLVVTKD